MTNTMIRQPVPGVHDLIPPQGRVCVELLDDRGRVKQRVREENAILTHWQECMKRQARGGSPSVFSGNAQTDGEVGYNFHGSTVVLGSDTDVGSGVATDWWINGLKNQEVVWSNPFNFADGMRNIILSDATDAVDVGEVIFPGTTAAYAYLRETYAPSTNTKRTQLVTAQSYRTPTALRYVAEWGTTYGNGTHNSVGIGNTVFSPTAATQGWVTMTPYAMKTALVTTADTSTPAYTSTGIFNSHPYGVGANIIGNTTALSSNNVAHLSAYFVSNAEFWSFYSGTATNNLCKTDFTVTSVAPFSAASAAAGLSVTGPTGTTIGCGTNRCGVVVIGSDLWLAYQGTLKRCVKPTNASLSVTNTYTPGGIENCIDLATDGTDIYWLGATTVYKINPTTGAITTSWAHGITSPVNICWMGTASPYLAISYDSALTASLYNASPGTVTARQLTLVALFTLAGVAKGVFGLNPTTTTAVGTQYVAGGIAARCDNNWRHFFGPQYGNLLAGTGSQSIWGPSHLSRTVLGSPVVKTSANSMRVTYEFGF